jgi:alkanesulfonate monooxygenase SsuD/methylene tetrahydromethanopterin reductase-like flavin-dependent oxidoreductase (luciferase family)
MPKQMHLALDVSWTQVESTSRMPGSWVGRHYPDIGLFEDIARIAERGLFDMIFFGDGSGIPNTWEGGIDAAVRRGVASPRLDMSPWITAMSRVTSHVGFGLTYASTFMHPFYVARLLNSLDHITNGRIAFQRHLVAAAGRLRELRLRRIDRSRRALRPDGIIHRGLQSAVVERRCRRLCLGQTERPGCRPRQGATHQPCRPVLQGKGTPERRAVAARASGIGSGRRFQARDMGRGGVCRSRIRRRQRHPAYGAAAPGHGCRAGRTRPGPGTGRHCLGYQGHRR